MDDRNYTSPSTTDISSSDASCYDFCNDDETATVRTISPTQADFYDIDDDNLLICSSCNCKIINTKTINNLIVDNSNISSRNNIITNNNINGNVIIKDNNNDSITCTCDKNNCIPIASKIYDNIQQQQLLLDISPIINNRTNIIQSPVAVHQNRISSSLLQKQQNNNFILTNINNNNNNNSSKNSTSIPSLSSTTTTTTTTTTVYLTLPVTTLRSQYNNLENEGSNTTLGPSYDSDNMSTSITTTTTTTEIDNIITATVKTTTLTEENQLCNNILQQQQQLEFNDHLDTTQYKQQNCMLTPSHEHYQKEQNGLATVNQLKPQLRILKFFQRIFQHFKSSGIGDPSVYHALVVIFLEFFAWGLLTMPVISVLNQTFPDHTFLMNGLVMGIKGILSFLSAPLIGALSDIWGRKFFLLITVFFTCAPIPLMTMNTWWFFAMISISGVFAVTFSVVFAYVADVTTIEDRSRAYGLVSATFAASLVISPALGATLMEMYSDTLVVALATAIAVLDVFFILVAVPESLPEKVRPNSWGAPISWEQADPFAALRKVGSDHTILMQCVTVFLSYLPEAGQYSCIFVYLKLKMGFNSIEVSIFIAIIGILSILIQITLGFLMKSLGAKRTIIIGLIFEMMQLLWYGFGSQRWMMWAAGILAALGSITYPAISAFVSIHSLADRQGVVQGMVTGMRGLCNGLGPAMFGVIFYLFHVDLNDEHSNNNINIGNHSPIDKVLRTNNTLHPDLYAQFAPGPPFVFGAFMVICAILVAVFIPEGPSELSIRRSSVDKKRVSLDVHYEIERGRKVASPLSPLMRSDSSAQL